MNKLDITKTAGKFLEKLPPKQFRQIVRTIFKLREVPEPHDSKQLFGHPEFRRVDIGEYRIIYRVDNDAVKICLIGKRNDREIYRRFKRSH
jgi:mRNA interferase RelE/StbE